MSFVYGITDQLTGYSYTAGALAAAVPIVLAPRLPQVVTTVTGLVPRFVLTGAAGYAVGTIANDDCSVLKGIAGGVIAETALRTLASSGVRITF
jgi:hypothetical protein